MDKIFLIDKNTITYNNLIDYINLNVFSNEYTEWELFILNTIKNLASKGVSNHTDLINVLHKNNKHIELLSSGTTGEPKVIYQSFKNMVRNISISEDDSVWAMFYHPNRMAGYQVLFQTLLNGQTLVNMRGYDYKDIQDRILTYNVTNISATPTLYKMILGPTFDKVKQITFGGDGSTKNLQHQISKYFPNARIKNIYASTEGGSLFASNGESFHIPIKYMDKIKIVDNEIHIHNDLVGLSTSIEMDGDWYNTGDLIEFVTDTEFKIVGRSSNVVKVAGYNVNLESIESKILKIEGIKLCKVSSKYNSVLGNMLIAEIILLDGYSLVDIKRSMRNGLEKFEIPTKISFVESIELSENGKIKR